jgi:hypothetical protein
MLKSRYCGVTVLDTEHTPHFRAGIPLLSRVSEQHRFVSRAGNAR